MSDGIRCVTDNADRHSQQAELFFISLAVFTADKTCFMIFFVVKGGNFLVKIIDDFLFAETHHSLHVCNAPSPAATSAIPIARHIVDRLLDAP